MTESYTQRLNQFKPTTTWQLGTDSLLWQDDKGGSGEVKFANIREVRLRFEPTRVEDRRFATRIDAGQTYAITNIHYRGPLDFEDRSEAYRNFVNAFHERLAAAKTGTTFRQGSTMGAYIGNAVLILLIFAILAFAMFYFFMSGVLWIATAKLIIILFFAPVLIKLMRRNKPGTYTPDAIPQDLLPEI